MTAPARMIAALLLLALGMSGASRAATADAAGKAPSKAAVAQSGQHVVLAGTVAMLDGEDLNEQPVRYLALVLDAPLPVHDEDAGDDEITEVTLWPAKQDNDFARRMPGRHITVEGRLDYYGFGPSTVPNPWKLAVDRWR